MSGKTRTVLAQSHPGLAAQWHPVKNQPVTPQQVSPYLDSKVWWMGQCQHEWEATIKARARGTGCPVCSGRKVVVGVNDLTHGYPHIAAQWDQERNDLQPEQVTCSSNRKVWWKDEHGHSWQAKVQDRTRNRTGCPYCTHRQVLPGFNDLATVHPQLCAQWNYDRNEMSPQQVTAVSGHKVWWVCDKGHQWQAQISNRAYGTGCPVCSRRVADTGINDLTITHPALCVSWSNRNALSPQQFTYGSAHQAWWDCPQGHEWQAAIKDRAQGSGCPVCSGHMVVAGVNDVSTTHPAVAAQWHPTLNTDKCVQLPQAYKGQQKHVWWVCDKGHEWQATLDNRTRGSGCPTCASQSFVSRPEKQIRAFLDELGVQYHVNVRSAVPGYELDIYVPDHKFAIEFNGLYWHSERFKDRRYHLDKLTAAQRAGLTLFTVWEDDWQDRGDIVRRAIAHRLHRVAALRTLDHFAHTEPFFFDIVGARHTTAVPLTYAQSSQFLNQHHIQGACGGTSYLGLVDTAERIRAVMVVQRVGNVGHEGRWRIERYASAGVIPGGFSKLLSYAQTQCTGVQEWVTFADLAISDGGLYDTCGFVANTVLPPDYTYLVRGRREHKFNYRLARFRTDPALRYEEGLSERQLAQLNGLLRVWDYGKTRYVKQVPAVPVQF